MSPRQGAPPVRRVAWMVLVALVLLLAPAFARAVPRPEVTGTFGGSFAVAGSPDGGGTSVSLALLWPVADGLRFGVMGHADDAGTAMEPTLSADSVSITVERAHRMAMGASWRLDAERRWKRLVPFASVSFGTSMIADDVRGTRFSHVASATLGFGAGMRMALSPHVQAGASWRFHRLFNDREGRFMSAGLDFSWR